MTTTLRRPEQLRKDREEFHEFLESHDELDTLAVPAIHRDEDVPERGHRLAAALAILALVVAAIVVGLVVDFGATDTTPNTMTRAGETEDEALARLVQQGYVPPEALVPRTSSLTAEQRATIDLVNRGLIPAEALVSRTSSLTAQQRATIELVNRGLIPAEALVPDVAVSDVSGNDDLHNLAEGDELR